LFRRNRLDFLFECMRGMHPAGWLRLCRRRRWSDSDEFGCRWRLPQDAFEPTGSTGVSVTTAASTSVGTLRAGTFCGLLTAFLVLNNTGRGCGVHHLAIFLLLDRAEI
jgi:hypothetical protein